MPIYTWMRERGVPLPREVQAAIQAAAASPLATVPSTPMDSPVLGPLQTVTQSDAEGMAE